METYFNINYEFDRHRVHAMVENRLGQDGSDYICVSDGVVLNNANRNAKYLDIVNGGMFSICDSSYVPIYLKFLYGIHREQYSGSQIFEDYVKVLPLKKMIFLGGSEHVLKALKNNLSKIRPEFGNMKFVSLPFKAVEEFDYEDIARTIESEGAEIIWVALGAPKQETFMSYLKPHLSHGVMIGVGAVFKFFSGLESKRAPKWMVRNHLEFVYRIFSEPKKQIVRCKDIIVNLPGLLWHEYKTKKHRHPIYN